MMQWLTTLIKFFKKVKGFFKMNFGIGDIGKNDKTENRNTQEVTQEANFNQSGNGNTIGDLSIIGNVTNNIQVNQNNQLVDPSPIKTFFETIKDSESKTIFIKEKLIENEEHGEPLMRGIPKKQAEAFLKELIDKKYLNVSKNNPYITDEETIYNVVPGENFYNI